MKKQNVWLAASPEQKQEIMTLADNYMNFLSLAKTERRFVKSAIQLAEGFGYKNINEYVENNLPLHPQDKVYYNMMDKAVVLFHVGSQPLSKGMNAPTLIRQDWMSNLIHSMKKMASACWIRTTMAVSRNISG